MGFFPLFFVLFCLVFISNTGATLPAAPVPALGLLGTAVPTGVTPLVRPPFFVQNPLVLAGAATGLGAAALGTPGLVMPPVVGAVDAIGQPSEYLLLKNMFDPSTEVSLLYFVFSKEILFPSAVRHIDSLNEFYYHDSGILFMFLFCSFIDI